MRGSSTRGLSMCVCTAIYIHDVSYPGRWAGTGRAESGPASFVSPGHRFPRGLWALPEKLRLGEWGQGGPDDTDAPCPVADPGPSPSAAPAPPACWNEPANQHYFSSLAAAACPPASPSEAGGASSSSTSSSSAASLPAAPRGAAEGLLSARSRSNSAERLLEAVGGADEPPEAAPPGEGSRGHTRAVENQYSFY